MKGQTKIELPSERYGHEPGILLEFIDSIVLSGEVRQQTAYNYYMTARTLVKYLYKCRYGVEAPIDEIVLSEITPQELTSLTSDEWNGYILHYRKVVRERKGAFAIRVTVFRRLYKWLEGKTGHQAPEFIMEMERPKVCARTPIAVSPQMLKEILENLNGEFRTRNVCIVLLAARCGLGLDEIAGLEMEDLKLNAVRITGLDGRTREVPLDDSIKEAFDLYIMERVPPIDEGNPLFVSKKRGRMKRGAMQKMLRKAVAHTRGKTQDVTFRDLQQTWMKQIALQDGHGLLLQSRVASPRYIKQKYGVADSGGPKRMED